MDGVGVASIVIPIYLTFVVVSILFIFVLSFLLSNIEIFIGMPGAWQWPRAVFLYLLFTSYKGLILTLDLNLLRVNVLLLFNALLHIRLFFWIYFYFWHYRSYQRSLSWVSILSAHRFTLFWLNLNRLWLLWLRIVRVIDRLLLFHFIILIDTVVRYWIRKHFLRPWWLLLLCLLLLLGRILIWLIFQELFMANILPATGVAPACQNLFIRIHIHPICINAVRNYDYLSVMMHVVRDLGFPMSVGAFLQKLLQLQWLLILFLYNWVLSKIIWVLLGLDLIWVGVVLHNLNRRLLVDGIVGVLTWLREVIRWGGDRGMVLARVTEVGLFVENERLHIFLRVFELNCVLSFLQFDRVYCVHVFRLLLETNLLGLRDILIVISSACVLVVRVLMDSIWAFLGLLRCFWILFLRSRLRILTEIVWHTSIYRLLTLRFHKRIRF